MADEEQPWTKFMDPRQAIPGDVGAMMPEAYMDPNVSPVASLLSLPQRSLQAAQNYQVGNHDTYDPGPIVESAMMMMGGAGAVPAEANALRAGLTGVRKAALPMDEASRLARAKELGYRTNMPLYHGTGETFNEFTAIPSQGAGFQTPGVSLARDPAIANEYAMSSLDNARTNPQGVAAPQVHQLYHRADRPVALTLTGDEAHHEVVSTLQNAFDQGYDSVMLRNYTSPGGQKGDVIIVKDSNQLRSPNAAFDPAEKNSGFLLGSGSTDPRLSAAIQGGNAARGGRLPATRNPLTGRLQVAPAQKLTDLFVQGGPPVDLAPRASLRGPSGRYSTIADYYRGRVPTEAERTGLQPNQMYDPANPPDPVVSRLETPRVQDPAEVERNLARMPNSFQLIPVDHDPFAE